MQGCPSFNGSCIGICPCTNQYSANIQMPILTCNLKRSPVMLGSNIDICPRFNEGFTYVKIPLKRGTVYECFTVFISFTNIGAFSDKMYKYL